jgi:hypothetical protein
LAILFHLAIAAVRAISDRFSPLNAAALAGPPFFPPRLPNATAAGFFRLLAGLIVFLPVMEVITCAAISFISLLDRLRMATL